jgi:hypothetical protein
LFFFIRIKKKNNNFFLNKLNLKILNRKKKKRK